MLESQSSDHLIGRWWQSLPPESSEVTRSKWTWCLFEHFTTIFEPAVALWGEISQGALGCEPRLPQGVQERGHPEEMCGWTEGGTISGVPPLGGQVRPQMDKTAAIASCPPTKTKKEVRWFLGLGGYYRRFVPGFVDLTSPLIDLTRKGPPDLVQWVGPCQAAFVQVKKALCGKPLLHTPRFSTCAMCKTPSDPGSSVC